MEFNVIWIDDEWDKMEAFKEECEVIHHIYLHPYRTQKAGMEAFDKNPKIWDAIILDAKMFDESEDELPKLDGLRKAVKHINEKSLLCPVPFFISTGQPDLMNNDLFQQAFGAYYIKERDDSKLIEEIKNAANNSKRFKIKKLYSEAIKTFRPLDIDTYENIIDILVAMHHPELPFDYKLYFNPLRIGLEYIFRAANQYGIISDDFFLNGNVNLNQCFMFLSGRDAEKVGFRFGEPGERVVPKFIQDMMSLILNIGNSSSHSVELCQEDIEKYDSYLTHSGVSSKYLVFSMALHLCEIASWMNHYIADHPNKEDNLKKCVKLEISETNNKEVIGVVEQHGGVFHVDCICLNPNLIKQKKWLGKTVKISKCENNTNNKTKSKFPLFATKIELIEGSVVGSK